MEVVVVMAILVLLAAVVLPSIYAFRGDTRPQAAADAVRTDLANARGRAMQAGTAYRVAVSGDGKRIRRAPDTAEFAAAPATDQPGGGARVVEYAFDDSTAEVFVKANGAESGALQKR